MLAYFALGAAAQMSGVVFNTELVRFTLGWSSDKWDEAMASLEGRGLIVQSRQVRGLALILATSDMQCYNSVTWRAAIRSLAGCPEDIWDAWLAEYRDEVPAALLPERPEASEVSEAQPEIPEAEVPAAPKPTTRKKRKTEGAGKTPQTRLMEYYEAKAREAGFEVVPLKQDYVNFAAKLKNIRRIHSETDDDAEIIFRELIDLHFGVYDRGAAQQAYRPGTFIVRFDALLTLLKSNSNPMVQWWHNYYRHVAGLSADAPIPFNPLAEIGYVNCITREIRNVLYSSGYLSSDNTEEEYERAVGDGFKIILTTHRQKRGDEVFVKYGLGGVKPHLGRYMEILTIRLRDAVRRKREREKEMAGYET